MNLKYAGRMKRCEKSDVAEIMKVIVDPTILSLAGGLPAPELFPVEEMKEVTRQVMDESGQAALQYSSTQGVPHLRELIASRMNDKFNSGVSADNILITDGSQEALDLAGKVFLEEGDIVLCESPTYLGALDAFKVYGARTVGVETDDCGMIMEDLEKKLKELPRVRLIYVNPDFQNPTGINWSVERRKAFVEIVSKYGVPAIEDNPYGELRFDGNLPPSLKSFDEAGVILSLGSFSKIFCPGMRVAWMAADEEIVTRFATMKQNSVLCSPTITQMQVAKFMDVYDLDAHVVELRGVYERRLDVMVEAVRKYFPAEVKVNRPEGGLFLWAQLPASVNARDVLTKSVEAKVAFVPGGAFFAEPGHENFMRMNYSNVSEEMIVEAVRRLGEVLKNFM